MMSSGEHIAVGAVDVFDVTDVGVHLGAVEVVAGLELQSLAERLVVVYLVAEERDLADLIARAFVDEEHQRHPVFFVVPFVVAADLGTEVAQAAVVVGQPFDVLFDLAAVDVPFEQVQQRRLALDLRLEPPVAGDVVALEADTPHFLRLAFMDQIDRAAIRRLLTFQHFDFDVVVALGLIVSFDLAGALLDGERVERIALLELGLLGQRARLDFLPAQVTHVFERGPLDDAQRDHHAAGGPLAMRLDVHEPALAHQLAHVAIERRLIERLIDLGADVGQHFFARDRAVALDANVEHVLVRGRGRLLSVGQTQHVGLGLLGAQRSCAKQTGSERQCHEQAQQ
jgi:hypothetical protein